MKTLPTLYKQNASGKIIQWDIKAGVVRFPVGKAIRDYE